MPGSSPVLKDPVVTMAQAADALGVSPRTLRYWIANGTIPPPIKLGARLLRYRVSDLERLLRRRGGRHD